MNIKKYINIFGELTLIASATQSSLSMHREGEEGESKITSVSIFLTIFLTLVSYLSFGIKSDPKNNLNTAATVTYLSPFEKDIIYEINLLRTDPSGYAEKYIAPLAKNYNGRILYYPGDKPLKTKEGVRALNECIRDLKKAKPAQILYPSAGLTKAARDHVKDQSRTGATGHIGSDHSNLRKRVERYGNWNTFIGENIAYGGISARQVIIYLLIDDGVNSRGHRENMLNPIFKTTGVASGKHPGYGSMYVMDFAASYTDKMK